jgi:molybdate-binding protein
MALTEADQILRRLEEISKNIDTYKDRYQITNQSRNIVIQKQADYDVAVSALTNDADQFSLQMFIDAKTELDAARVKADADRERAQSAINTLKSGGSIYTEVQGYKTLSETNELDQNLGVGERRLWTQCADQIAVLIKRVQGEL